MITLGTALNAQCFIVKLILLDIIHISLTDKKFQCALLIPFLHQVLIQQSLKVWHGGVGGSSVIFRVTSFMQQQQYYQMVAIFN